MGEAGDGRTAINVAREVRPDLVIMDVQMPDLDGIAAAEEMASEQIAPVLLLTAYSQPELVERARETAAIVGYLVKPFRESDLAPAIEVALARHREFRTIQGELRDIHESLETRKVVERAKGYPYRLLPVFHNRNFSYTQIAIRRASGIRQDHVDDLKGRRFAVGDYQQTGALWVRGVLQHEFGIHPRDIDWDRTIAFRRHLWSLGLGVAEAESIIEEGVSHYQAWLSQRRHVPLIQQVHALSHQWHEQEFARALKLLEKGEAPAQVLEQFSRGLRQKMMHPYLQALSDTETDQRELAEASLKRVFLSQK